MQKRSRGTQLPLLPAGLPLLTGCVSVPGLMNDREHIVHPVGEE